MRVATRRRQLEEEGGDRNRILTSSIVLAASGEGEGEEKRKPRGALFFFFPVLAIGGGGILWSTISFPPLLDRGLDEWAASTSCWGKKIPRNDEESTQFYFFSSRKRRRVSWVARQSKSVSRVCLHWRGGKRGRPEGSSRGLPSE